MSFASICCPLTPPADSSLSSFATSICDVYRLAAVCPSVLPFGAPNWQEIGKVLRSQSGPTLAHNCFKSVLAQPNQPRLVSFWANDVGKTKDVVSRFRNATPAELDDRNLPAGRFEGLRNASLAARRWQLDKVQCRPQGHAG